MKFTHKVEVQYKPSFRSEKIAGMFDIPPSDIISKEWDVDIPLEQEDEDWGIGIIVGPSGAGKTTLSKVMLGDAAYHTGFEWGDSAIVDDFPSGLTMEQITGALSHVGFGSPPDWRKPYRVLSNGQKFRAEIARSLLTDDRLVVFDEFTSVVDRTVAKSAAAATAKFVRRQPGKQFVAVSCHYDIIEWMEPDWVYHVDTNRFEDYRRGLLRRPKRPEIDITVRRVHHSAWRLFKDHHYLTGAINKSAHCYVAFMDDRPIAFCAALKFPHDKVKDMWKAHRTVVLPDYQGLGIGGRLSETIARYYHDELHQRYTSVTSHPAFIASRMRNPRWRLTRAPGQVPAAGKNSKVTGQSVGRMTAAFEYIGEPKEKK